MQCLYVSRFQSVHETYAHVFRQPETTNCEMGTFANGKSGELTYHDSQQRTLRGEKRSAQLSVAIVA